MADINSIFEQLKPLSLFELHRLNCAIFKLLNDPARNDAIKRHLRIGMEITYFSSARNDLVEATVVNIRKTRASVINKQDNEKWNIELCAINLQGINTSIKSRDPSGSHDRNSLKVGDRVGWHSKLGYELYGVIEKLNPKKALVRLGDGAQWTVSYSLLFLIMEGVSIHDKQLCIEGEVIHSKISEE